MKMNNENKKTLSEDDLKLIQTKVQTGELKFTDALKFAYELGYKNGINSIQNNK